MKVNKGYIIKLHTIFQKNLVLDGITFILNLCVKRQDPHGTCVGSLRASDKYKMMLYCTKKKTSHSHHKTWIKHMIYLYCESNINHKMRDESITIESTLVLAINVCRKKTIERVRVEF